MTARTFHNYRSLVGCDDDIPLWHRIHGAVRWSAVWSHYQPPPYLTLSYEDWKDDIEEENVSFCHSNMKLIMKLCDCGGGRRVFDECCRVAPAWLRSLSLSSWIFYLVDGKKWQHLCSSAQSVFSCSLSSLISWFDNIRVWDQSLLDSGTDAHT